MKLSTETHSGGSILFDSHLPLEFLQEGVMSVV